MHDSRFATRCFSTVWGSSPRYADVGVKAAIAEIGEVRESAKKQSMPTACADAGISTTTRTTTRSHWDRAPRSLRWGPPPRSSATRLHIAPCRPADGLDAQPDAGRGIPGGAEERHPLESIVPQTSTCSIVGSALNSQLRRHSRCAATWMASGDAARCDIPDARCALCARGDAAGAMASRPHSPATTARVVSDLHVADERAGALVVSLRTRSRLFMLTKAPHAHGVPRGLGGAIDPGGGCPPATTATNPDAVFRTSTPRRGHARGKGVGPMSAARCRWISRCTPYTFEDWNLEARSRKEKRSFRNVVRDPQFRNSMLRACDPAHFRCSTASGTGARGRVGAQRSSSSARSRTGKTCKNTSCSTGPREVSNGVHRAAPQHPTRRRSAACFATPPAWVCCRTRRAPYFFNDAGFGLALLALVRELGAVAEDAAEG